MIEARQHFIAMTVQRRGDYLMTESEKKILFWLNEIVKELKALREDLKKR